MKLIGSSIPQSSYALIAAFVMAFSLMSFQNSTSTITNGNCPTASFSAQSNLCESVCPVVFNNKSTGGTSYRWDFGDGQISCEKNPVHQYSHSGTFSVKLTVVGATCTSEFIGTVDIVEV